jgi:hypothetical protein
VEATPKSAEVTNGSYAPPISDDAQLIIDATDARGRCHDQGTLGARGVPNGGLEIIDITDIENPVEIGLTSHIGESHTVNIDPKRPHIAYSVTSDSVGVTADRKGTDDTSDDTFTRNNETSGNALDGFEVVDLSSCMLPPYGTLKVEGLEGQALIDAKREQCQPKTYRYRYPTIDMALGHTLEETIYGCHETEIYTDDTLTCAAGAAVITLDMAGAFEKDAATGLDKPKGTPLPCFRRASSSGATSGTGAKVMDCVNGGADGTQPLSVSAFPAGNTSLQGVEWIGSAFHAGRADTTGALTTAPVTEDIDFNHEVEYTRSGDFVIATDERGGGVTVGAQCDIGNANSQGNGGIHAYQVDELTTERPVAKSDAEEADIAYEAYARGTDGEKAVFRAPLRTGAAEGTFCTSHVMQQIPDQNRIFMGYYTQGTQVVDYVELPDGRLEWIEDQDAQQGEEGTQDAPATPAQAETSQAGFFIPEKANTWVSHIFKTEKNDDGTFTTTAPPVTSSSAGPAATPSTSTR